MTATMVTFRILRFDPEEDEAPYHQEYSLDVPAGMTVLEALLRIQADQDGSLAFRYACRGAVCGSCAMMINGREALACRTQVRGLFDGERTVYQGAEREGVDRAPEELPTVTVEPLRNLTVIKDLVVDMAPFLGKVRAVEPWLQPEEPEPERERRVKPDVWEAAEPYTNCILCACCHSVCPAAEDDPDYLGPAALAKNYRFLADVRDAADAQRIARVNDEQGVWGCDMVFNCVEICPKGVPPTKGIGRTRARIRRSERE
jgi:succinate dehydrogenase / fumarate reductase iron-sulfur subunit